MYSVFAPTVLLQCLTSAACGAASWRWGNRRRKSFRTRRNFSMSSYTDTTNGFDQDSAVSIITVRMIRILLQIERCVWRSVVEEVTWFAAFNVALGIYETNLAQMRA